MRFSYAILASLFLLPSSSFGQDIGDKVFVVAERAELKAGNKVVVQTTRGASYIVRKVNGSWYWVSHRDKQGWINRKNVIAATQAMDYFTKAIEREPTARDYRARSELWRDKSEYTIAVRDASEAIRLDNDWYYYVARAIAWEKAGNLNKAIEDYSEAIRLHNSDFVPWAGRGQAFKKQGEYKKAIADLNESIGLHPYASSYISRGFCFSESGDGVHAVQDFENAIKLDPGAPDAYSLLAWTLATDPKDSVRDGRRAVELATKGCELAGWKGINIDCLAAAYAEIGDFENAIKWQLKAEEFYTDEARRRWGVLLKLYQAGKPYREEPKEGE